jgi:hypothetical protein
VPHTTYALCPRVRPYMHQLVKKPFFADLLQALRPELRDGILMDQQQPHQEFTLAQLPRPHQVRTDQPRSADLRQGTGIIHVPCTSHCLLIRDTPRVHPRPTTAPTPGTMDRPAGVRGFDTNDPGPLSGFGPPQTQQGGEASPPPPPLPLTVRGMDLCNLEHPNAAVVVSGYANSFRVRCRYESTRLV